MSIDDSTFEFLRRFCAREGHQVCDASPRCHSQGWGSRRMTSLALLFASIAVPSSVTHAWGQAGGSNSKPPAASSASEDSQKKSPASGQSEQVDAPKSLDELLGVPSGASRNQKDSSSSATDAASRDQAKRLERSLDEATLPDLVQRAIEGMQSASARLTDQGDAGLGTQRIQEDVVKSLERLLEEAQKQQKKQQSSSSSSSSSSRQRKQGKDGKSDDPSERNGQQRQPSSSDKRGQQKSPNSASGETEAELGVRDSNEVSEGGELSESRVEWGQLPERVRELVLQGRKDRVSTIYERLTREYYRRLAEEASK
jgi:hypothetical protein